MHRKLSFILAIVFILAICVNSGFADQSEGDMYTFCPFMSTLFYNEMIKNFLDLNDTQAALLQVSSDGLKDGNLVYSDILSDTIFIFGGTTNEYGTATSAYIYCSLKDNSTLKNIPMIIWASIIQLKYYGKIEETGSSFLEWVNGNRTDGEIYTSPYFIAQYTEEPYDNCTLLLVKR